jgi:hypothetical protein
VALCAAALGLATMVGTGIAAGKPVFERAQAWLDWKIHGKLRFAVYGLSDLGGKILVAEKARPEIPDPKELYESIKRELTCWEPWSIEFHKGQIMVTASEQQHRRISKFLRIRRGFESSPDISPSEMDRQAFLERRE